MLKFAADYKQHLLSLPMLKFIIINLVAVQPGISQIFNILLIFSKTHDRSD